MNSGTDAWDSITPASRYTWLISNVFSCFLGTTNEEAFLMGSHIGFLRFVSPKAYLMKIHVTPLCWGLPSEAQSLMQVPNDITAVLANIMVFRCCWRLPSECRFCFQVYFLQIHFPSFIVKFHIRVLYSNFKLLTFHL